MYYNENFLHLQYYLLKRQFHDENFSLEASISQGSDPVLVEVTGFFVLCVFFAVSAILIQMQFFRRINFISFGYIVGRFAHSADESNE